MFRVYELIRLFYEKVLYIDFLLNSFVANYYRVIHSTLRIVAFIVLFHFAHFLLVVASQPFESTSVSAVSPLAVVHDSWPQIRDSKKGNPRISFVQKKDGELDHLSQFLLILLISPWRSVLCLFFDRKPGIRVESRQQSLFAKTGDPDKRFFKL